MAWTEVSHPAGIVYEYEAVSGGTRAISARLSQSVGRTPPTVRPQTAKRRFVSFSPAAPNISSTDWITPSCPVFRVAIEIDRACAVTPVRAASAIAISIRFMSTSPLSRLFTSGRATAARTGVRTRGATSSPSIWFPADWPRRRAARATYERQCVARTFFRADPRESPS